MDVGGEGASADNGPGDGESNTLGGGEIDIERRISIIAICSRIYAGINCRPNYSASGWKSRRAIILCVEGGVSFRWGATLSQL
jgi:hypothetical protein